MKKETIKVCYECDCPLIWTFAFDYKEYYCLNCGGKTGMLGGGEEVPLTKELKLKSKIVNAIWTIIYGKGWLLPNGNFGKTKCKKCSGNNHREHLSKKEIEKNEVALKLIEEFKGKF